mmetsp:Transcript_17613/g.26886  ORF Transcript_17613/g.26886 Transcript_17613/m.26886 type:complete len:161 (-) Transcript_17613:277-759(-)
MFRFGKATANHLPNPCSVPLDIDCRLLVQIYCILFFLTACAHAPAAAAFLFPTASRAGPRSPFAVRGRAHRVPNVYSRRQPPGRSHRCAGAAADDPGAGGGEGGPRADERDREDPEEEGVPCTGEPAVDPSRAAQNEGGMDSEWLEDLAYWAEGDDAAAG